jgi:protein-tyrosine phosphatase
MNMPTILFVCLGNICRSPCAQGVLEHLIKKKSLELDIYVESCGLGDWNLGQLPDERMRRTAEARGVILSSRAQSFRRDFFDRFDYIFSVDQKVLYELYKWALTPEHKAKIHLMTRFSKIYKDQEIPDPYYYGQGHFDLVMDMIEDSCEGLLEHLSSKDQK